MAKNLSDMERGSGSVHLKPSIDVLITGRSGTSKSILINGIFGKEVVKERHGVVNVARSSAIDFYSSTIDGVQVNVWVSSHLQDGVVNEAEYLHELKRQCSKVDLIMYCLKMTETRFVPGNPDAQAITKITQTLGYKCWEKAIFVLTYANVAAEVNYDPQAQTSNGNREAAFQDSIKMWKTVIQNTLSKEAGVPNSLKIRIVPAGHYRQPHLPDRKYWLSVLWSECHQTMPNNATREAFRQINIARFRTVSEVRISEFSQYGISDQPLVTIRQQHEPLHIDWNKWMRVFCGAGVMGMAGFLFGHLVAESFPLAIVLLIFGIGIGGYVGYVIHEKKYF